MNNLTRLIDPTTFGTVRRFLNSAHSPITTVMVVQHRETLPRIGATLIAEDRHSPENRRQWTEWCRSGEVRLGGCPGDQCIGVDLDAIPDQTLCDVLYLPPMYLVCLRGYKPSAFRVGPAWPYPRNS